MLEVKNVTKTYKKSGNWFRHSRQTVLKDLTFTINAGECVSLVGESGSGKSTLSRLLLGLEQPDKGTILMNGMPISQWKKENKGQMSVVFQDYISSVNPNFTVKEIIKEPLLALHSKINIDKKIQELMDIMGLPTSLLNRYPHELSGGQLQKACIARAISTYPKFLVLDEALRSLDVTIQTQILDVLLLLKEEWKITYFFITHDLLSVAKLSDRIIFLYKGSIVEEMKTTSIAYVQHEYSKTLLNSVIGLQNQKNS